MHPYLLRLLKFGPLFLASVMFISYTTIDIWFVFALASGCMATIYILQLNYLARTLHKKIVKQIIFAAAAVVLPIIAVTLGNYAGEQHFGTTNSDFNQLATIITGLYVCSLAVGFCAFANALTIMTGGANKALHVLGYIGLGVLWAALAALSWFIYMIVYSLHDPNTE